MRDLLSYPWYKIDYRLPSTGQKSVLTFSRRRKGGKFWDVSDDGYPDVFAVVSCVPTLTCFRLVPGTQGDVFFLWTNTRFFFSTLFYFNLFYFIFLCFFVFHFSLLKCVSG